MVAPIINNISDDEDDEFDYVDLFRVDIVVRLSQDATRNWPEEEDEHSGEWECWEEHDLENDILTNYKQYFYVFDSRTRLLYFQRGGPYNQDNDHTLLILDLQDTFGENNYTYRIVTH